MPELPEVETVRRTLNNFVRNETIDSIEIRYNKIITGDSDQFIQLLSHETIRDIDRVGKYLIFVLDHYAFISHLRMEGKYNIKDSNIPYNKHDHVIFHFSDGTDLRYNDTRKFGRMILCDHDHYREEAPLNKLGPEPMEATFEEVYPKLHHKQTTIKQALLDQEIMSGIGNIYANEILFLMKIDPRTKASRLSKRRVEQLIQVSSQVLTEAIAQGGTTIHSFDANGIHGLFQVQLNVHGQKICPVCKSNIRKITVGGRGTYYCPNCQKRRY